MLPVFGENPDVKYWWAGASASLIGILFALGRLYFWWKERKHAHDNQVMESQREREKESRRSAAEEAWEVVDRLSDEVSGLIQRMNEMENRHAVAVREAQQRAEQCEREHAETKSELGETRGRLAVIESWARLKGLKIDGSDFYRTLSPE